MGGYRSGLSAAPYTRRSTRDLRHTPKHSHSSQGRQPEVQQPQVNSDFVEFLHKLLDTIFLPITYPLKKIRELVTSPMTISVVLRIILLVALLIASASFSILAVGAFWWSWGTGGNVEVEGWLVYGSRANRTPHSFLTLPPDRFQEDLPYDVQVEFELVRSQPGAEEMGNFMVTLELRSLRSPDTVVVRSSQPSLPPPPLPSVLFTLPTIGFPSFLIPPCIIPWPLRGLCPSRLFGYGGNPHAKIKERQRVGTFTSPARGNDVVLLTKELLEGVTVNPGRGDSGVGSILVSIGREDTDATDNRYYREVRTTGWVVVRFIPHPTGIRWLLTANPIPPLIILPPISLALAVSSALLGYIAITYFSSRRQALPATKGRRKSSPRPKSPPPASQRVRPTSPAEDLAQAWDEVEAGDRRWDRSSTIIPPRDEVLDAANLYALREMAQTSTPRQRQSAPTDDDDAATETPATQSVTNTATTTPPGETGSSVASATPSYMDDDGTEETWDETASWDSH